LASSIYAGRKIGGAWLFSILPVLFAISSIALLYLVTLGYEKQIFIFIATSMYYIALLGAHRLSSYNGDRTARGMNMAALTATIFFAYAASYGLYLNFLVPLFYLMMAYGLVTLLVSCQFFFIIKKDEEKRVWMYSFLLSLTMVEIIWTMNFWPFGYLTTGVIALILYYVLWDLTQSYFSDTLSRKRVIANIIFFSVIVVLVLLSAKWLPII
jgi:hypothetical protein